MGSSVSISSSNTSDAYFSGTSLFPSGCIDRGCTAPELVHSALFDSRIRTFFFSPHSSVLVVPGPMRLRAADFAVKMAAFRDTARCKRRTEETYYVFSR